MISEIKATIDKDPLSSSRIISLWVNGEDLSSYKEVSSKSFSGVQKAAILFILLGKEYSGKLMENLSSEEIDDIVFEIARQDYIVSNSYNIILEEFLYLSGNLSISKGGVNYSREILENKFGSDYSVRTMERLTKSLQVRPFDFLNHVDYTKILHLIKNEHPQVISLILYFLDPQKSSSIIKELDSDTQESVLRRLPNIDNVAPETIREIERSLEKRVSFSDYTILVKPNQGFNCSVDILNSLDEGSRKIVINNLEDNDPELAEELKKNLVVFRDVLFLSDRSLQIVMREIDSLELAKAIKGEDVEIQNKFFNNMSKAAGSMLKEDMDYMGPVCDKDVQEAQCKIVSIIKYLEDNHTITRNNETKTLAVQTKSLYSYERNFEIKDLILFLDMKDVMETIYNLYYDKLLYLLKSYKCKGLFSLKKLNFIKRTKLWYDFLRDKRVISDLKIEEDFNCILDCVDKYISINSPIVKSEDD